MQSESLSKVEYRKSSSQLGWRKVRMSWKTGKRAEKDEKITDEKPKHCKWSFNQGRSLRWDNCVEIMSVSEGWFIFQVFFFIPIRMPSTRGGTRTWQWVRHTGFCSKEAYILVDSQWGTWFLRNLQQDQTTGLEVLHDCGRNSFNMKLKDGPTENVMIEAVIKCWQWA